MITQISIFTENRHGAARKVFSILAKANINVLNLVNSDSGEFGTMRIIVSDPELALRVLKENDYLCKADFVFAAELEDKPGSLERLLSCIEAMNINVGYMYVGYIRETATPVIFIHCDDMDIVENALKSKGFVIY